MLTKREEGMVLGALHEAVNGKKICFVVPSAKSIKKCIQFVYEMRSYLYLINMTDGRIKIRTSPGEVHFIASDHQIEKLKGLEYDVAFFNETEPVPEEVFTRVRKNVKN